MTIRSPYESALADLCSMLRQGAIELDRTPSWPEESLRRCFAAGVTEWFVDEPHGGQGWTVAETTEGLLHLGAACLTTAFVITQITAAIRRVAASSNRAITARWLPELAKGDATATVGVSHLSTSRQHLARPVMQVQLDDATLRLDGMTPWVTGAAHVDFIVTGAVAEDGQQVLVLVPRGTPGITYEPPEALVGLTASQTCQVRFHQVVLGRKWLLAGPKPSVVPGGGQAGGLPTSTLALALAMAAGNFLKHESMRRPDLRAAAEQLDAEISEGLALLRRIAAGSGEPLDDLRTCANSLALRTSQAALAAAKGAGYVVGHPAGRWCREALFFLVWSCPQSVIDANLCELAGVDNEA